MPHTSQLYSVGDDQLAQIRRLANRMLHLLQNRHGSPIDPAAALAALQALFLDLGELEVADYKTEQFLYLVLPDEVLLRPIEELDLEVRTFNSLKRDKVDTLGQLLEYSEADLLEIRNFGSKSLDDVKQKLAQQPETGLHLSRHDQGIDPPPGDAWVRAGGHTGRTMLRSRLPLLLLTDLTKMDDDIIYYVFLALTRMDITHLGHLLDLTKAEIRALDWGSHRAYIGNTERSRTLDPQIALRLIRTKLGTYGLSLRDE